ncbi:MAG: M14 family metallopeptidase [Fimbriimonas sp.]
MFLPALILAEDWSLHYERSQFLETGRYEEAVAYCRRLAKASPYAKVVEYGTSPQGRKMIALLVSRDREFDPTKMRASKKPLVFIQNGIHSGEIEGKDATLMLAREMLVTGKDKALLEGANFVIVPIYSVDAHERFSPYNRINQNGPREMGWRATAQNYNLNRDWIKADAPETRAQVRLVQRYRPDFLFDNHTTDGSDHPYVLTLGVPSSASLPDTTSAWQRRYFEAVRNRTDRDGFFTSPYFSFIDTADPAKGITVDDYTPRYSNGYWGLMNRPSVLVETHVLKPYRQRVEGTLSLMRHTIAYCIGDAKNLKAMNAAADASEAVGQPKGVLSVRRTNDNHPFTLKTHPYIPYRSEVGGTIPKWDRSKIVEVPTKVFDTYAPAVSVTPPAAYAIPPEWTDVIDRIELHGLRTKRLKAPLSGSFATFKFEEITFGTSPFEGRFQPRFRAVPSTEDRTLPPGTVIVSTRQVGSNLLVHLLEPEAPDSLMRWGFFNNVFEQKEYYETYAMEPVAVEMLRTNPQLKAEYDEKLRTDARFAAEGGLRLRWLFERSPYYDPKLNRYPVVRLTAEDLAKIR